MSKEREKNSNKICQISVNIQKEFNTIYSAFLHEWFLLPVEEQMRLLDSDYEKVLSYFQQIQMFSFQNNLPIQFRYNLTQNNLPIWFRYNLTQI